MISKSLSKKVHDPLAKVSISNFSEILTRGICLKSTDWTVLWQNESCLKVCGDRLHQKCQDGCRKLYLEKGHLSEPGCSLFKFQELNGQRYDVVVIHHELITTFLCSVEDRYLNALQMFHLLKFSKREIQITLMMMEELPNAIICQRLYISDSTLKSHIHRLRIKVSDAAKIHDYNSLLSIRNRDL